MLRTDQDQPIRHWGKKMEGQKDGGAKRWRGRKMEGQKDEGVLPLVHFMCRGRRENGSPIGPLGSYKNLRFSYSAIGRLNTSDQSESNQPGADQSAEAVRDERIQSPHDRLINQTLQQIDAARTLLADHLPREVVEHMQLDTLSPVDTSFVDQNLRRRFADRLFSVKVSDEVVQNLGMKTNYVYVFVLIDHKSTDDPATLVQMLGYIVRIWENALTNNQPLVPVLPWVIYNGVGPWRSSRSLAELIPVPVCDVGQSDCWRREDE
jgi:hypothetical protein